MSKVLFTNMNGIRFNLRDQGLDVQQIVTAVHEAGHAVVAMALGAEVTRLHIHRANNGRDLWTGRCEYDWNVEGRNTPINGGMITAAAIASMRFLDTAIVYTGGDSLEAPVDSDERKMRDVYDDFRRELPGNRTTLSDFWEDSRDAAYRILKLYKAEMDALTVALLRYQELNAADVRTIVGPLADAWKGYEATSPPATSSGSPKINEMTPTQRHKIVDALEKVLAAQAAHQAPRPAGPTYRVGEAVVETRDLIPGLRYSEPVGASLLKVR